MAKNKKNLTPAQIMQLIQTAGGVGEAGLSKKQLLAAILSSPNLLTQMQAGAEQDVSPYAEYDPSYAYNPAEIANPVQMKYMQDYGPKYEKLISDYWSDIVKNPSIESRKETIDKFTMQKPELAKRYGISEEELDVVIPSLTSAESVDAFQKAEQARQKKQFAAFSKNKIKLGVRSPETATEDYLKKTTGLAGLGEAPKNMNQLLTQKTQQFLASGKNKGKDYNEAMLFNQIAAKVKKGKKSVAQLSAADLIKKNLTGL